MGRWIKSKICDTHAWECHQETQYFAPRIYANNKEEIREERKKGLTVKDSTDCRDQKEGQCSTATVGSYINSNEHHASVTNYNAAFSHMYNPPSCNDPSTMVYLKSVLLVFPKHQCILRIWDSTWCVYMGPQVIFLPWIPSACLTYEPWLFWGAQTQSLLPTDKVALDQWGAPQTVSSHPNVTVPQCSLVPEISEL